MARSKQKKRAYSGEFSAKLARSNIDFSSDEEYTRTRVDTNKRKTSDSPPSASSRKKAKKQQRPKTPSRTQSSDDESMNEEAFIALPPSEFPKSRQQRRHEERIETKEQRQRGQQQSETQRYDALNYRWMAPLINKSKEGSLCADGEKFDIADWFHEEVQTFIHYIEPTPSEAELRRDLVERIRRAVQKSYSTAKVSVFGSYATNMYLPNSDIDLNIDFEQNYIMQRQVARILERAGICAWPTIISRARVPVIKLVDLRTNIKVDIVINSPNGVEGVRAVQQMLRRQPALRPLSLIIKHFLALRSLNEVFSGGLGGYAIICLVYHFLQMHPMIRSGKMDPMKNLSVLLIEFFDLYGNKLNHDDVALDVRGNCYTRKDSYENHIYFAIIDPNDSSNDLGVKSFKTDQVIKCFRRAYDLLLERMHYLDTILMDTDSSNTVFPESVLRKPSEASVLGNILHIPNEMLNHRELQHQVASKS